LSGDFRKIQKKSQIRWMLVVQCEQQQQPYVDLLLTPIRKSILFVLLVVLILVLKVHKNIGTRVLTLEFYILSVENVL